MPTPSWPRGPARSPSSRASGCPRWPGCAGPRTRRSRSTRRGGSSPTVRTTTRSPGPSPTRCTWTCSPGWREAWQRGDAARRGAVAFLTGTSQAPGSGAAGLAVTVVNALARERDGMATATVRLAAPGTPWLTVTDPVTGDQVPALADGVRRHGDGSLAEVTLTFRARAVPALGFLGTRSPPPPVRPGPVTTAGRTPTGWRSRTTRSAWPAPTATARSPRSSTRRPGARC